MAPLPSIWELLLPNLFGNGGLNVTVLIGIVMLALLVVDSIFLAGAIFTSIGRALSVATNGRVNPLNTRIYFILIALVMIYAVSIFQDFTRTTAGTLILIGGAAIIVYLIMIITRSEGGKKSVSKAREKLKL